MVGAEAKVPPSVRGFRDITKATALEEKKIFHSVMNFPVPKRNMCCYGLEILFYEKKKQL